LGTLALTTERPSTQMS